jgi:cytochrome P450
MALSFNLFTPEILADPYPLYHALRAESPVYRTSEGQWVLTRYADVVAALSDEELLWNCVLLLIAGHETVMDLVGNGLRALLRHSGELQKLRAERSPIPAAVEELLRYDAPFQFMQRQARQDVEIGGLPIRAGERVWLMLGAANRDPAVFPDPDRLDLTRSHHRQIAFGLGIHFCAGPPWPD